MTTHSDAAAAVGDPVEASPRSRRRVLVGETLPAVLDLKDLESVLGLGSTRIWQLYQAGDLDFALLRPTVGRRPRFSGKQLQAWMARESVEPAPVLRPVRITRAKE